MHANRKSISVALCAYNGEKFLSEQLESILHQTVSISEIVICDDASTDKTWQLIRAWQQKYPEIIKAVRNNSNIGYVKNFEKAISLCTGDIIFLSDQDDIWYEYKVEKVLDVFSSNTGCEMVVSDAAIVDVNLSSRNTTLFSRRRIFNDNEVARFHQKYDKSFFYGCTMVISASLREHILPIPENWGHDNWIGFIASTISKTQIISEPLMLYRYHGEGAGKNDKLEKDSVARMWRHICSVNIEEYERDRENWNDMYVHLAMLSKKIDVQVRDAVLKEVKERRNVACYRLALMKDRHLIGIWKAVKLLINGSYGEYLRGWRSFVKDIMGNMLNGGTGRRLG